MPVEHVDPDAAKAILEADEDVAILDVRSVEEFEAGHVEGAWNVPLVFRGRGGVGMNEEFPAVVQRRFPTDMRLVLI
jgi:predicted sulfurtransferase